MESEFQILVDSDAFVGRFYPDDKHHQRALQLFSKLEQADKTLTTTSMVLAETATVLSHRSGQVLARKFLEVIKRSRLPTIHIDERLHSETYELFCAQEKKGTSFTDCANVVVMQRFKVPTIFSFDKAYPKQFGVSLVG